MTTIKFIDINTPITGHLLPKRKGVKDLRILVVGPHLQKTIDVSDIKSPADVAPAQKNIKRDRGKLLWKKNKKKQK
jgi:hypothetical protein